MNSPALHVIFGTGQIGPLVAREALGAGERVRLVSRRPDTARLKTTCAQTASEAPSQAPTQAGDLEVVAADARDPSAAAEACRDADVVYHCANPPYHRWPKDLLRLGEGIRAGAARQGARLVVLDNLYAYGRPPRSPFDEDTPLRPCSRKGELRAEARRRLFAAHERGEVQALSAHASDFVGPDAPLSLFGPRFVERLRSGRPLEGFHDLDQPHAYAYTGDVARALFALGSDPSAFGRAWHIPSAWTGSTRALFQRFAAEAGHPGDVAPISPWFLRAMGLIDRDLGGLVEMLYQWSLPYVPDARRFTQRYFGPAPIEEVIGAVLLGTPHSASKAAALA